MASGPRLREIVYQLVPRPGAAPRHLPLLLAAGTQSLVVETRVAHLDDTGHVWRILTVAGRAPEIEEAKRRFRDYRAPFVVEKSVMDESRQRLLLWYKYRAGPGSTFSHTALALRRLGRDTLVTDTARAGLLTVRIVGRAGPRVKRLLREARERSRPDFDFRLLYVGPPRDLAPARLGPEEEATLAAARRLGVLDIPRRAGLRTLARELGITASAAGYRLRKAQRKLIDAHLGPA